MWYHVSERLLQHTENLGEVYIICIPTPKSTEDPLRRTLFIQWIRCLRTRIILSMLRSASLCLTQSVIAWSTAARLVSFLILRLCHVTMVLLWYDPWRPEIFMMLAKRLCTPFWLSLPARLLWLPQKPTPENARVPISSIGVSNGVPGTAP